MFRRVKSSVHESVISGIKKACKKRVKAHFSELHGEIVSDETYNMRGGKIGTITRRELD